MIEQLTTYYTTHFDKLVKILRGRAGNDAEDVVQEAFYRALKYKESYNIDMPLEKWFGRILSNSLKNYKNMQKGYSNNVELEEEHLEPVDCPNFNNQLQSQIEQEMMLLNESHSEIVSLYFLFGYSIKEVSSITDQKYKTVDSVIQRFKHQIREKYGAKL